MKKALFIRLDRMGDLILTLPCDQLVTSEYNVHWITPKGLDFVVKSSLPKRNFTALSREFTKQNFNSLYYLIKNLKPDVALCYHVPWWVHFCLWLSRVKVRGGVLSQWHSYLFLNKGLRQKRSGCEHHEMEYNFLLTEFTFGLKLNRELWKPVKLKEPNAIDFAFDFNQHYFVVHPGMGGSALNWPTDKYVQLIDQLSQRARVVVTGTKSDDTYLIPLKKILKENHQVVWLDKQLDGNQLLKLLKNANAVIAPSTGVLHLGASLGVPSLGIYSPIKVHRDKRWGPKGVITHTYTPKVECPAKFECIGSQCSSYFCMNRLSADPVIQQAFEYL